jgi:hypothetical protein
VTLHIEYRAVSDQPSSTGRQTEYRIGEKEFSLLKRGIAHREAAAWNGVMKDLI